MKSLEVYISGFMILFGAVIFRLAYSMEYYGEYGPGPGLLTTLLSAVAAGYFYFPPYQAFTLDMQPQMLLPVLIFCIDGVIVSLAIGAMHHYYARYRRSIAELQARELRYRGAVETTKDGFLLLERSGRVAAGRRSPEA